MLGLSEALALIDQQQAIIHQQASFIDELSTPKGRKVARTQVPRQMARTWFEEFCYLLGVSLQQGRSLITQHGYWLDEQSGRLGGRL